MGDPRRGSAGRGDELAARAAPAQPDRAGSRRPGAHRLGDRLGRARDAPRPVAPVRLQRLLPAPPEPRLLRFAARLRPGGVLRPRHRRRTGPLQPAVPVGLVAVLRRRLSARARAGPRAARRRRRGRGLRLRALPRDRGGASARDLLRRHTAGAVPAAARLPALLARPRARRLAGLRLADQPRLHARPAVQLSARLPRCCSCSGTGGAAAWEQRTPQANGAMLRVDRWSLATCSP